MASIKQRGKSWRAMIKRVGYKSVSGTFDSYDEAKEWADDIESQMKKGKVVKAKESESTTLKQALERYMLEVTPTKGGEKQERNRIKSMMILPLSDWNLSEIGTMQIAQFRDSMLDEDKAPTTIRNKLTILSQVFKTASTEWGMYELDNPVKGVRLPKHKAHRERRLEGDEEALLLSNITVKYKNALLFSLETAARRGEVCNLKRSDINVKKRIATISRSKNGKARAIPLSSAALRAIEHEPIHINRSLFDIAPDSYTHAFSDAVKRSGIDNLTLHDIRHEAISRFVESGLFGDAEIMKISGHTTMAAFMIYVQVDAEKLANRLR